MRDSPERDGSAACGLSSHADVAPENTFSYAPAKASSSFVKLPIVREEDLGDRAHSSRDRRVFETRTEQTERHPSAQKGSKKDLASNERTIPKYNIRRRNIMRDRVEHLHELVSGDRQRIAQEEERTERTCSSPKGR